MDSRDWIYQGSSANTKGVTLSEAGLQWWETGHSFVGGASTVQTVADFLAHGPPIDGVPAELVTEVSNAIRQSAKET